MGAPRATMSPIQARAFHPTSQPSSQSSDVSAARSRRVKTAVMHALRGPVRVIPTDRRRPPSGTRAVRLQQLAADSHAELGAWPLNSRGATGQPRVFWYWSLLVSQLFTEQRQCNFHAAF